MTAHRKPHPVIEHLITTFSGWLKHRREMSDIRQLSSSEFDRIASELKVSPDDLNELVRKGPHAADQLPKLLDVLGIDEQALKRTEPLVLRDMERVCALCHHKGECVRDLASGVAAERYEDYCANAPTIDRLGDGARR